MRASNSLVVEQHVEPAARSWRGPAALIAITLLALLAWQQRAESERATAQQQCRDTHRAAIALDDAYRELVLQAERGGAQSPSAASLMHSALRRANELAQRGARDCAPVAATTLSARLQALQGEGDLAAPASRHGMLRLQADIEGTRHAAEAAYERRVEALLAASRRDLLAAAGIALLALGAAAVLLARAPQGSVRAAARARAARRGSAGYLQRLERKVHQLGEHRQRLAEAQQLARLGNWNWKLSRRDAYWSDELYRVLGIERGGARHGWRAFLQAIPRRYRRQAKTELRRLLRAPGHLSLEHRIVLPNEGERVLLHQAASQADASGKVVRLFGSVQDVSERRQVEDDARRLALFDPLTELPNRRYFKDHVQKAIARAKRLGSVATVMFIDLDHFKRINDTLGHGVGDELLRQAAERLVHCVRGGDVVARDSDFSQLGAGEKDEPLVARLGGDEFTVLLVDLRSPVDTSRVARRIIARIAEPFAVGPHELFVTASLGMSVYPDDGDDAEQLLRHADAAMYEAKRKGKNTFQFFTADLHAAAFEKLEIERELRRAMERGDLALHFQPKVNVRDGRVAGVEALLRWNHPQWGYVAPARFIPAAEELGLIVPIGDWVLEAACAQMASWRAEGVRGMTVAVNMASPSFRKPHLAKQVAALCERYAVPPSALVLEVTESLLMQDMGAALQILRELRELGVRLSIDDFGTGYSSLSYLQRLPISQIKIDQSFVRDLVVDRDHATITKAIISLGRALDHEMVAEGVETAAQARMLMRLGCDMMQGYYFSPALPAAEVTQLLSTGPFMAQMRDTTFEDSLDFGATRR